MPVTRLRFRLVDVTTLTSPVGTLADLRALDSTPFVQPISPGGGGGTVNLEGLTVETPPAQPNGGGVSPTC